MSQRDVEILVAHGRIPLPRSGSAPLDVGRLATVVANLTYYGYALDREGLDALSKASDAEVERWWPPTEGALRAVTGDDREMDAHVVYKSFPAEVLAMDEADYWLRQILMYWGFDNALFTEPEASRAALRDDVTLKVLAPATEETLLEIYRELLRRPSRWTPGQRDEVAHLAPRFVRLVPLDSMPFKENLVELAAIAIGLGHAPAMTTATDVLRLATRLSGGDVSLRERTKLRSFSRRERRALLAMLEGVPHLADDVARRRERFKRLLHALRPGDYAARFPRVVAIHDVLYRGAPIETNESRVERLIAARDPEALKLLAQRPGVFLRRLHECVRLFGADAAGAFEGVLPKLKTLQLLKVLRHLETEPTRAHRAFPPRGNWARLQTRAADPARRLPEKIRATLTATLEDEIARRVTARVGSVRLDPRAAWIKLQSNDSDLTPYGRGTVFPIPERVTFLRTASYWESGPTATNLWYDNGWTFYDAAFQPLGVCCWNRPHFAEGAAVFSGDPTNSKDLEGRACQLVDVYLDRLAAASVRYALWNLLCYSRKSFDEAVAVHAALQWGEHPEEGKLFEPSRCQLSFPVRGSGHTKYIAYVDVERRQLVYVDANLYGRVSSAGANTKVIGAILPAFLEHVEALPTVHDLFRHVPEREDGLPVLYDDAGRALSGGPAYVFAPVEPDSAFEPFDLSTLLG